MAPCYRRGVSETAGYAGRARLGAQSRTFVARRDSWFEAAGRAEAGVAAIRLPLLNTLVGVLVRGSSSGFIVLSA